MARHKPSAQDVAALVSAGFEMGFDEAIALTERIEEAWGEESGIARELRKMRAEIIKQRSASIAKYAAEKTVAP